MSDGRRVALVANGGGYVGPLLATRLAGAGHDLVLGDPADGLEERCAALGATVVGVRELPADDDPRFAGTLVDTALDRFGRLDAATTFGGAILPGWFLGGATREQLDTMVRGIIAAPFEFLQAVLTPMVAAGRGQVLVFTSSTAARPTPRAPVYSALRAGAEHLVRNVAAEVASKGVQVNAIGTNYMDFDGYWAAVGGETPQRRASLEAQVPMARMGGLDELAEFALGWLDGTMGFATGQTVRFDGGWSI